MRTTTEVQTDIDELITARSAIIKGERINDVSRDGRRIVFQGMTLNDVSKQLAELNRELAQAEAVEAGRPRRRPVRIGWTN
jgi:hypothetical protein